MIATAIQQAVAPAVVPATLLTNHSRQAPTRGCFSAEEDRQECLSYAIPTVALVFYPAAPHVGYHRHQLESARFAVAALARCRAAMVGVLEWGY